MLMESSGAGCFEILLGLRSAMTQQWNVAVCCECSQMMTSLVNIFVVAVFYGKHIYYIILYII